MTSPNSRTSTPRPSAPELAAALPRLGRLRPTFAVVDLDRLAANFRLLDQRVGPGVSLLPVVKADAYGHGAVAVARRLEREGAGFFAVALVEEGLELRRAGIEAPILLLGVLAGGQVEAALENRLTPAVFERGLLERLDEEGGRRGRRIGIHLKIDTGMGRIGFPPCEHDELVRFLSTSRGLEVAGVFTNFASADDPENPETARQIERLDDLLGRLDRAGIGPGIVHASNSAGILAHPPGWKMAVRPGLTLYGLHPGEKVPRAPIRPVLALETTVIQVKNVPAGTKIGYAGTFETTRPSRIATLPVGYDDGYPRACSVGGRALFDSGEGCVSGRVSMDMTIVDVTNLPAIEAGSPATLIGERGGAEISATELAALTGTIPYEILCHLGRRVPRVWMEGGRVTGFRSFLDGVVPEETP
jgi:alanine racemase